MNNQSFRNSGVAAVLLLGGCASTTLRVDTLPANTAWRLSSGIGGASDQIVEIPESIFEGQETVHEKLVVFGPEGYLDEERSIHLSKRDENNIFVELRIIKGEAPRIAFSSDPQAVSVYNDAGGYLGTTPFSRLLDLDVGDKIHWKKSDYVDGESTIQEGVWAYQIVLHSKPVPVSVTP